MRNLSLTLLIVVVLLGGLAFGCAPSVQNSQPVATPETSTATPSLLPTLASLPTQAPMRGSTSAPNISGTSTPRATESPTAADSSPKGELRVHFIDVGQGDSVLIQSPDGKNMLIDGGERSSGVVAYLRTAGVNKVDIIVATHPHSDHIGGLVDVLGELPVAEVWISGQEHTTKTFEDFLDAIDKSGAGFREARRGDSIRLGGLFFQVLNPGPQFLENLNNDSIVLRLTYGDVTFLFPGDAEKEAEAQMLASGLNLRATILKVGHHGSRSSSSPQFLRAVEPKVAIYMAGRGNTYGHPHQETLIALNAVGAEVYGTDVNGSIVVVTDGQNYVVKPERQAMPRGPPGSAQPTLGPVGILPIPGLAPTATLAPTRAGIAAFGLEVVSVTSPVRPGANATLKARSVPGAECTVTVYYKSGASTAQGLVPKKADGNGDVSWTWPVGTKTTPGTWRIVVTASYGGKSVAQNTYFKVE